MVISFEHIENTLAALPDERDKKLYSWETFGIPFNEDTEEVFAYLTQNITTQVFSKFF